MRRIALFLTAISMAAWACGGGADFSAMVEDSASDSGAGMMMPPSEPIGFGDAGPGEVDAGALSTLRYNEVQQKATHNSYDRDEPNFDQLVYHRIRALEFDLHIGRSGESAVNGDWYVYHADLPTQNNTNCFRLSDCLASVKSFHDTFPQHEVVTVFLDLKDNFDATGHAPADLDALLLKTFDPKSILKPSDLLAACPTATNLKEAVTGACAWPMLKDLRGKIVFADTGGSSCDSTSKVNAYAGGTPGTRASFVAPDVNPSCPFLAYAPAHPEVLFFNMDKDNMASAALVHDAGLLSRVYYGGLTGGLDDQTSFERAKNFKTTFLATNKVNAEVDTWARTYQPSGWPFACFGPCESLFTEQARTLGVMVESADLFGTMDSFLFLHEQATVAAAMGTWTSMVSVVSSHVEPFAKGCLMARASEEDDAAYFAVCRTADVHVLRVQYRSLKGASTTSTEVQIASPITLDAESNFFIRLVLEPGGTPGTTTASGDGSVDGKLWTRIDSRVMQDPLVYQGIAASAHGNTGGVKFLLSNLTFDQGGMKRDVVKASLPTLSKIGGAMTGSAFDGFFP